MGLEYPVEFILGGCRSGKSRFALEHADGFTGSRKTFIATCVPHDEEMLARVDKHQRERGDAWFTVEAPLELAGAVRDQTRQSDILLVDCLTLWISNLMAENTSSGAVERATRELVGVFDELRSPLIIVSNEVGTGIVPENRLARRYRDLTGWVNQQIAARADSVYLVVAGIAMPIKTRNHR